MIYKNALEWIGNTPLLHISHFDTGPCDLYLKLEFLNPSGSIKDRIALAMIESAEKTGKLQPGGTIIEATAGSTGLSLALVASQKGYQMIFVSPDKISKEKIANMKAFGAKVILTRSDVTKGHPDYYQDRAEKLANEIPGACYMDQFCNKSNVLAHEYQTGPEIWEQMSGNIDAFVAGIGTGGTLTGIARYLKNKNPNIKIILADPFGSILAPLVKTGNAPTAGRWLVEGIGEDFVPPITDLSVIDEAFTIQDADAIQMANDLLRKEGVLVGSSTGTLFCAALKYCRQQTEKKRVVTLACDSGLRYLSKIFDQEWLKEHLLIESEVFRDLRDLLHNYDSAQPIPSLSGKDSLYHAMIRMRSIGTSEMAVIEDEMFIGIVHEYDVLLSIQSIQDWQRPVADVMKTDYTPVSYQTTLHELIPLFKRQHAAAVMREREFLGILTKDDIIRHLRKKLYE